MSTVLEANQCAIVAGPDSDSVDVYLPALDDSPLPEICIALVACAMRINDDLQFREDMLDWFMAHTPITQEN